MQTRYDEMLAQVKAYHKQHPEVFKLFCRFAFEKIGQGFNHYSAKGVFERIRWETSVEQTDEFKLCNNYTPFYARAFMGLYPEHRGFFRTKVQISKTRDAVTHVDRPINLNQPTARS